MIFSVYFRKIIGTDLDYIFNLHDNILMCGDFNAKHAMWNCITENNNGRKLFDYYYSNNVQLEHPLTGTFRDAVLDFVLVKDVTLLDGVEVIYEFCSDHLPIIFNTAQDFNVLKKTLTLKTQIGIVIGITFITN